MTEIIRLTKDYEALVDDADYEAVMAAGPWHAVVSRRTVYAGRKIRRSDGAQTGQGLHQFLTGWPLVDHRDGDGLNNQRSNLRAATHAQNAANMRPHNRNKSGYKGVYSPRRGDRWRAGIWAEGRSRLLGYFDTAKDAALAYDAAAFVVWGEYAWLNFPDELTAERINTARERLNTANPAAA